MLARITNGRHPLLLVKEVAEKIWTMPPDQQLKVVVWLWRWWTVRNKANADERVQSAREVCSSV
jgi:hypothetical protein